MDVFSLPLPETHIWPLVLGMIAAYIGGSVLIGGLR